MKKKGNCSNLLLQIIIIFCLIGITAPAQTIRYVTPTGSGSQNGLSWSNAAPGNSLQLMINASSSLTADQVWVAAGTYTPTHDPSTGTIGGGRDRAFLLKAATGLYGGFVGTETALAQANPTLNITTLSGDFNNDDVVTNANTNSLTISNTSENAYHVAIRTGSVATSSLTLLSGFTISGGNADGAGTLTVGAVGISRTFGGGLFSNNGNPAQINNCTFIYNSTKQNGGAIYNNSTNSTTYNSCKISNNLASNTATVTYGAGVYMINTFNNTYTNCFFENNITQNNYGYSHGSGAYVFVSTAFFQKCIFKSNGFLNNTGNNQGGAIIANDGTINVNQCVFDGNGTSCAYGGAISIFYNSGNSAVSRITNSIFKGNSAGNGGGIYAQSGSTTSINYVVNNTFISNSATSGGGGFNTSVGGANYLINNIFLNNTGTGSTPDIYLGNMPATLINNQTQATPYWGTVTGNSILNPIFTNSVNPIGADATWYTADDGIQLQCTSPCVNTGTTSANTPTVDVLNVLRPQGSGLDRGAYEQSLPFTITSATQTNVLCNGYATGMAGVLVSTSNITPTYSWLPFGATTATVTGLPAGNYTVYVINAYGCPPTTQTFAITQPVALSSTISASANTICAGNASTLNISGSGGTGSLTYSWVSGPNGNTNVVSPAVNSTYTATITDANNCIKSGTILITVNPSPAISVNSGAICIGSTFTITPGGASTYTISGGANIVSPTATTNYSVTGTSALGCVSSNTAVSAVTVNVLPTISVNSGSVCSGQSFTIVPGGAITYTIQGGSTVVTPASTASYNVIGADALGCVSSNTAVSSVTVNALPVINAVSTTSLLCAGQTASLTVSGANTYSWNTSATTSVIAISPGVTTTYTVNGTGINGCSNVATITQSVSVCTGISKVTVAPEAAINVYPNPGNGIYTIEAPLALNLSVIDLLGKVVYNQQLQDGKYTINLSHLNNGLYILKAESNGVVKTLRLVKE